MSHFIPNFRAENEQSRLPCRRHYLWIIILLILLCTSFVFAACSKSISPTNSTPTTIPEIVATAWTASLVGKLEMIDGCLRVISVENDTDYVLVWPPDYSITIDNNKVRVVSGIVTGNHREILLNIGETVKMSGGETEQLSEQIHQSLPPNCVGPYWIVGFEVTPSKSTEEPN